MLAFKGILQKLKHRRRNVGAEAGRVLLPQSSWCCLEKSRDPPSQALALPGSLRVSRWVHVRTIKGPREQEEVKC